MKRFIVFAVVLIVIPFIISFHPAVAPVAPEFLDKLALAQAFFALYGFLITLIGVYEYIKNYRKRIKPKMFLNNRSSVLTVKGDQFPCHIDIEFHVLNDGNTSMQREAANYTILVPNTVKVHPIHGIMNEAGKTIVPGVRQTYHANPKFQALGGEIPVKVYPGRMRRLFVLNMLFTHPGSYTMYYYFTTDDGFFPRNVVLDSTSEPIRNLGKLVLHVR